MAAKKSRSSKKTAKPSKASPDGITVMLDTDTILTLNAAIEALSEFATAVVMASDDPTIRSTAKKSSKKRAKKSARKQG